MRLFDEWLLLPQRFAVHERTATAVLADVHLGYTAARQRLGDAIPARSVDDEMAPLVAATKEFALRRLVVAGDLFERGFDAALLDQFLVVLEQCRIQFLGLVPGNHDRGFEKASRELAIFPDGLDLAGWRVVHGDQPVNAARSVMGHWHPALRRKGRKTPCFLARGMQLVLPAFSLDAAGAEVQRDARWQEWHRFAIADGQVCSADRTPRGKQRSSRGASY